MSREGSATVETVIGELEKTYGGFPIGEERTTVPRNQFVECVEMAGQNRLGGARALLTSKDRVLLARYRENPDVWEMPGGSLDSHETHEQAARRHVADQLGVECEVTAVFSARRHTFSLVDDGDGADGLWVCFEAEPVTDELEPAADLVEVEWFEEPPAAVETAVRDRLVVDPGRS